MRNFFRVKKNKAATHFYETDIYTQFASQLADLIPSGFIVYGELIGFTPDGGPIQKDYTYNAKPNQNELYIYRVAVINTEGILVDLSWPQVKAFATDRGLKHVPELWSGRHSDFVAEDWIDKNFSADGISNAIPLSKAKTVDEGVVVRVDRWAPYLLKAKSPEFLLRESAMLDQEARDLEAEES